MRSDNLHDLLEKLYVTQARILKDSRSSAGPVGDHFDRHDGLLDWMGLGTVKDSCIPAISVDVDNCVILLNGEVFERLCPDAVYGVKKCVEADGDWVSWSGLGITKPERVKKSLPLPLRELLESRPGKGYRISSLRKKR